MKLKAPQLRESLIQHGLGDMQDYRYLSKHELRELLLDYELAELGVRAFNPAAEALLALLEQGASVGQALITEPKVEAVGGGVVDLNASTIVHLNDMCENSPVTAVEKEKSNENKEKEKVRKKPGRKKGRKKGLKALSTCKGVREIKTQEEEQEMKQGKEKEKEKEKEQGQGQGQVQSPLKRSKETAVSKGQEWVAQAPQNLSEKANIPKKRGRGRPKKSETKQEEVVWKGERCFHLPRQSINRYIFLLYCPSPLSPLSSLLSPSHALVQCFVLRNSKRIFQQRFSDKT